MWVYRIPCGKQDGISQQDWKNTANTTAEEILISQPLWSTPTSRTIKSTGRQLNSSHPSTHGIPDASERPSRSSSTTLFHRTSVSTSAIFGDPNYGPKDLLYPKSTDHLRLRDVPHPKSTTIPPPVLVNNLFSSVSTRCSPRIPVPPVSRLRASTH